MFDGQSLIYAPVWSPSWPDRYMLTRTNAESFRLAVQGTTFAQRTSSAAARGIDALLAPTDRTVKLISDGGSSDILADLTVAQILTAMDSYHDARRAAGADHIAIPTVVKAFTMTAGQNTVRLDLNDALRANPAAAGADQVVDVAAIPELADPTNLTYYYDGLHYTAAAATLVAALWASSMP